MEFLKICLEFLKVLLGASTLSALVALVFIFRFETDVKNLLGRIAKIKVGSAEATLVQSSPTEKKESLREDPKEIDSAKLELTPDQLNQVNATIQAHQNIALYWHYSFLNQFFVPATQWVLDWLIALNRPTAVSTFETAWSVRIPNQDHRNNTIFALQSNQLIENDRGVLTVTEKGKNYRMWTTTNPPPTFLPTYENNVMGAGP